MTGLPSSSPDWEKLGRYLAGESSPDEAATVQRWLEEHPADAQLVAALDAAARQSASQQALNVEAALLRVKTRAKAQARTTVWRVAGFVAAAAALFVVGVIMSRRTAIETPPSITRAYATGVGERDSVTLADGSRITIGPASRVEVSGREVRLTGEAYFRVVHDAARPFTVRAGDAAIRDLGTEFSVHSDPAEPVRVVVHEGIVEVVASNTATLRPGDVGIVTQGGIVATERGAATPDDMAWTRGRLVFRNASVGELTADLRRWYGVELLVTDSTLLRRHFTGSFVVGEPATQVLDAIALALGARVDRRGDTAYVRLTTPAR